MLGAEATLVGSAQFLGTCTRAVARERSIVANGGSTSTVIGTGRRSSTGIVHANGKSTRNTTIAPNANIIGGAGNKIATRNIRHGTRTAIIITFYFGERAAASAVKRHGGIGHGTRGYIDLEVVAGRCKLVPYIVAAISTAGRCGNTG